MRTSYHNVLSVLGPGLVVCVLPWRGLSMALVVGVLVRPNLWLGPVVGWHFHAAAMFVETV